MSKAILGVFEDPQDGAAAVDHLVAAGVAQTRISVLASETTAQDALAIHTHTKGVEGTAAGGSVGAAVGAILAGLTSVGALALGGAGLLVAGPLVAVLAGAGAGAVGGGILGGLIGLGFKEHEVKHYEDALEKGSVIVAVDMTDADDEEQVDDILEEHNATDVSKA